MKREVYLLGEITPEKINTIIEKILKFWEENPNEEITLTISSGGGHRISALGFYEFIRSKEIPLTTIAIGHVGSAVFIVFLSGRKRKATPHTWFTLHRAGEIKGDILEKFLSIFFPSRYKDIKTWDEFCREREFLIIKNETKIPEELIKKALSSSLHFNREKAIEWRVIHE